jgi:hypothetical protein
MDKKINVFYYCEKGKASKSLQNPTMFSSPSYFCDTFAQNINNGSSLGEVIKGEVPSNFHLVFRRLKTNKTNCI